MRSKPRHLDWDFLEGSTEGAEYHMQAAGSTVARLRTKVLALADKYDGLRAGVRTLMAASNLGGPVVPAPRASALKVE